MRKVTLLFLIIFTCLSMTAFAKNTNNTDDNNPLEPVDVITVEAMEEQLQAGDDLQDLLYIKRKKGDEDIVEIYEGLAKNRSWRKQVILKLPTTEMLRFYTLNKETYEQMSKMLLDYEADNTNLNGYKIITDVDNPRKMSDGKQVYRFWFMKIQREKSSRRGVNFPIGIGIGIGGHHHHGPWIGVGW